MPNFNTESLLLAEWFMEIVKQTKKDASGKYPGAASWKQGLMENCYACLQAGYPYEYLYEMMNGAEPEDVSAYNLSDYLKRKDPSFSVDAKSRARRKDNECIQLGVFYHHPALQESGKGPTYVMDSTTYEMVKMKQEPFFLEIRESFTLEDLATYFVEQMNLEGAYINNLVNQFRQLISYYNLDHILFMIDVVAADIKDNNKAKLRSPHLLASYAEDAYRMFLRRKEISLQGGVDHVIPRKRSILESKDDGPG